MVVNKRSFLTHQHLSRIDEEAAANATFWICFLSGAFNLLSALASLKILAATYKSHTGLPEYHAYALIQHHASLKRFWYKGETPLYCVICYCYALILLIISQSIVIHANEEISTHRENAEHRYHQYLVAFKLDGRTCFCRGEWHEYHWQVMLLGLNYQNSDENFTICRWHHRHIEISGRWDLTLIDFIYATKFKDAQYRDYSRRLRDIGSAIRCQSRVPNIKNARDIVTKKPVQWLLLPRHHQYQKRRQSALVRIYTSIYRYRW